jgi:hypothetical protein
MKTVLQWGALLTLCLTGCSGSASSLIGPDDIRPSMDPGKKVGGPRDPAGTQTCPAVPLVFWAPDSATSIRSTLRVDRVTAGCPRAAHSA